MPGNQHLVSSAREPICFNQLQWLDPHPRDDDWILEEGRMGESGRRNIQPKTNCPARQDWRSRRTCILAKTCRSDKVFSLIVHFGFNPVSVHDLLPRCYQDRTNQPHLRPCQEHPGLWFPVGLGCLRLGYRKFVNRRSSAHKTLKLVAAITLTAFA